MILLEGKPNHLLTKYIGFMRDVYESIDSQSNSHLRVVGGDVQTLAQQLDRSDLNSQISLIHLTNLQ